MSFSSRKQQKGKKKKERKFIIILAKPEKFFFVNAEATDGKKGYCALDHLPLPAQMYVFLHNRNKKQ